MSPQQTIAHYRITAKLGEGGMGEVWRATDTKLGRDVAIKILPEAFAQDADRMARFTREAQVLASLNHPNIAAIYGVEERALVMELVEGPTLAERIAQGAIPLEEALPIARQIVEALEYAHEKAIIHRDLKPANIKLTPEGRVKVLDFGLAKAMTEDAPAGAPSISPTLTMRATQAGMLLGTAAYMSPEQARGHAADRRSDIWSFGVLLYEMLTARQMFGGETVSDSLAAVLKTDPDWSALPTRTPPAIRRLLRRSLERDRKRRLPDIAVARLEIDEALAAGPAEETGAAIPAAKSGRLPWVVAGAMTVALAFALWAAWRATRPVDRPLLQFSVDLGPDAVTGPNLAAVLSPDGTRMVFPSRGTDGRQRLSIRLMNQPKATPLSGTENGTTPFFSPDGQWIGFFADQKMKKISVTGGAAVTLCDASSTTGASWGQDDSIIVALGAVTGLSRVPAAGGTPQPLTKPADKGEIGHRSPQILPGGQTVLFTANTTRGASDDASIDLLSLKTGLWKTVQRGGYFGRYLPSGHLVYIHQGTLFGVPFDPVRGELQGTPAPLLEDVASNPIAGAGQFDFSQTGTLVYLSGKLSAASRPLVWLDSTGKTQSLVATPGNYFVPRLSPDGKRLALVSAVSATAVGDILVYDLQLETMTKLTFASQNNGRPIWTPDGKHIAYASHAGTETLWWIRADGAGEPQRLLESKDVLLPYSFSPDGRRLAYTDIETSADLWTLPLDISDSDHPKPGKPEPFLRTPAGEMNPAFSPDGKWMAYQSNESGTFEVYVRPFPGPGGKWQISSGGGNVPVWSRSGRELLYETPDGHIMAAAYTAKGDSFARDKVRQWLSQQIQLTGAVPTYDLSPDGKRLVVLGRPQASEETKASVHVTFLLNYFDELRRRMPPK